MRPAKSVIEIGLSVSGPITRGALTCWNPAGGPKSVPYGIGRGSGRSGDAASPRTSGHTPAASAPAVRGGAGGGGGGAGARRQKCACPPGGFGGTPPEPTTCRDGPEAAPTHIADLLLSERESRFPTTDQAYARPV